MLPLDGVLSEVYGLSVNEVGKHYSDFCWCFWSLKILLLLFYSYCCLVLVRMGAIRGHSLLLVLAICRLIWHLGRWKSNPSCVWAVSHMVLLPGVEVTGPRFELYSFLGFPTWGVFPQTNLWCCLMCRYATMVRETCSSSSKATFNIPWMHGLPLGIGCNSSSHGMCSVWILGGWGNKKPRC